MERIYCEHYELVSHICATHDYDMDDQSCICTSWKTQFRKSVHTGCIYTDDEIVEMKNEDVYCPFWEIPYLWVDPRLLGDIL